MATISCLLLFGLIMSFSWTEAAPAACQKCTKLCCGFIRKEGCMYKGICNPHCNCRGHRMLLGMDESNVAQLTPTDNPFEWHRSLKGVAVQQNAGFFPFLTPSGHGITVTINGGSGAEATASTSGTTGSDGADNTHSGKASEQGMLHG
jgi:hypothetical protein